MDKMVIPVNCKQKEQVIQVVTPESAAAKGSKGEISQFMEEIL